MTDSEMLDFIQHRYAHITFEGFEDEDWEPDQGLGNEIWQVDLGSMLHKDRTATPLLFRSDTLRGAVKKANKYCKGKNK